MAKEISFPKARHLALSAAEQLAGVAELDISQPAGDAERCRASDGSAAGLRCVSSLEGRELAGAAAAKAAAEAPAVLLAGLDRWYRSPDTGYCRSCELALMEFLRESYGDHVQPFDPLEQLRVSALPPGERPFGKQQKALRLREAEEFVKRTVLRARDEARRARSTEIAVLGRVGPLSGLALVLCRHLDGMVFELPSLDPFECLLPLLAFRAALGLRPAVAALPAGASPAQVRQFAALAAACDTDLLLTPETGPLLDQHQKFLALTRERYRATEPLVDAEVLLSAPCDHWTDGAHQRVASAAVAALARAQLQPAVRLDLAGGARARLLVLAGCEALGALDVAAARRHVESGGDLLLAGRCALIDEEGRPGALVFPEAKPGLDRLGEGRIYLCDESPAALDRALRELVGRGRAQITLAGRGKLFARAYLDPERKLDLHLVNLEIRDAAFVPAQGVQLSIAGQAAGGSRIGYWFSPERDFGRDGERITLNPSGFSVSTILPSIDAYALLAVPR